jgi:hypothetical protein
MLVDFVDFMPVIGDFCPFLGDIGFFLRPYIERKLGEDNQPDIYIK